MKYNPLPTRLELLILLREFSAVAKETSAQNRLSNDD